MATRTPAQVFPPGEFIKEEMEARGWTQDDLATVMGRPRKLVVELIAGDKLLTPETAWDLGAAFGTGPEVWMNLESAYRLSLVQRNDEEVGRRARLYSLAPVKDMVKRQWIRKTADVARLEQELKDFFGVESLDTPLQISMAARKSATYEANSPEQLAWAARVRNLAKAVAASQFTPAGFEGMMRRLSRFVAHEGDIRRVPALLASGGVRLVLVEHLPRSYIDGVALWLDERCERSPVIGISTRYDRIDNFWFTLCHELAHIRHGDTSVDERLTGEGCVPTEQKPEAEQVADREAAAFLVPEKELEDFILRIRPLYYRDKIVQFANRIRVHPGIIVGQLQRRRELTYGQLREFLVKVRDSLKPNVLSDGWGFAPLAKADDVGSDQTGTE